MAKATVRLASGGVAEIHGTVDEVKELLSFYGAEVNHKETPPKSSTPRVRASRASTQAKTDRVSVADVIKYIRNCDEADAIESRILDTNSQVNRILLPLYVVDKHMNDKQGLTTGDISAVTKELGIPIKTPNVSNTLKTSAARYVFGDTVRRKGQPVRYRLSRRGTKYIEELINGKGDDE